jgi:hypothetical protein
MGRQITDEGCAALFFEQAEKLRQVEIMLQFLDRGSLVRFQQRVLRR